VLLGEGSVKLMAEAFEEELCEKLKCWPALALLLLEGDEATTDRFSFTLLRGATLRFVDSEEIASWL
jgi:hypothetical protein